MTPDSLERMQAIFEAAVDLPASERHAYLSRACDGDVELRAQVERLIEADDETDTIGGPLDRHAAPSVPESIRECSKCSRCYDKPISTCPDDGARLDVTLPGPLLIGSKYRIERCLGRGGMGAVYLAKHTLLEKYFALKVISTDGPIPEFYRKNFENEALALGRLKHPNIVDVTDYGVDPRRGGMPYLVMEYLEGRTIREVLRDRPCLAFPDAARLLGPVAAAIDCAHAHNIVHGDLKPANLFLARQPDGSEIVKVVDFGLAQLSAVESDHARATAGDAVKGTPAYMAPELFERRGLSRQSDRFAFGIVAYEMLTGSAPFGRSISQVRDKQSGPTENPSSANPGLPAELDAPILSLLDRIPELRPSSASAAVSAMEAGWLSAQQRLWRARELPRRYLFAAIAACVAVLIAGWLASSRVIRILESRTVDARFAMAAKHPPDPRLLVVTLDDAALAEDPRPVAQWDGEFSDLMERILSGGARALALDFLPPAGWSDSQKFARVIGLHSDRIALAIYSNAGQVIGTEAVGPLTAHLIGPQRYSALFGFVNLEEDEDGRLRMAKPAYPDGEGKMHLSFAASAVNAAALMPAGFKQSSGAAWIDCSVSPRDIAKVSWKDARTLPASIFSDKLVLIGADYSGSTDRHRVPATADPGLVPGVLIHAMIASTMAQDFPVRDAGLAVCLASMSLACFATIAMALRFPHRPSWSIVAAAGSFLGYAFIALAIFYSSRTMLVAVAPEIALLLSALVALRLRSYLAPYPVKGA